MATETVQVQTIPSTFKYVQKAASGEGHSNGIDAESKRRMVIGVMISSAMGTLSSRMLSRESERRSISRRRFNGSNHSARSSI
jgi:hypothetical protein